jgi:serine/threonine-protein kinase
LGGIRKAGPSLTKTLETPIDDLAQGTVIGGEYEVIEKLGRGGMGEVYRALDRNLGRQVAVKVLPEEFTSDPERLARFEREAKLLAALNHPNIAAVHERAEEEGRRFLILELVEGETLQTRLDKGALNFEEALETCRQVAAGLEAAHEKGIVHRDLKPGNIMIAPEGQVKILDFGLAKAQTGDTTGVDIAHSPTITAQMTEPGAILGTAAYMSPEQARGRAVDKQADIWAFGCVLYECLTGKRAYQGETVSDTLAQILKGEPDWSALPASAPTNIKVLLRRCLQKNPRERWHDISDVRIEISEAITQPPIEGAAPTKTVSRRRIGIAALITFIMTAIGVAVLTWHLKKPPVQPIVRTTIDLPAGQQLPRGAQGPAHTEVALSPDGKSLFFTASSDGTSNKSMLYLRPLDEAEAAPIPGTEGAREPFISPDGQWVGFWVQGKLKKVSSSGSSIPTVMCDCPNIPQGASWSTDGRIIIGTENLGLQLLNNEGGKLKSITTPDRTKETSHVLPCFLPGGRGILFSVKEHSWGTQSRIESLWLDSGERKVLVEDAADPRLTPSGYFIFVRASTLMAAPFDAEKVKLLGPAVTVAEGILQAKNAASSSDNSGAGQFQFSSSGQLLYASGGIFPDPETHTAWLDQAGKVKPVAALDRKPIISVRLSPDGKSFVYRTFCKKAEIWVYDTGRGTSRILTQGGRAMFMSWTPDGGRITCAYSKAGVPNIFWVPTDGSGVLEPLIRSENTLQAGSWSSDGRYFLYIEAHPTQDKNIWVFDKDEKKSVPLFASDYDESYPEFSPDGRYLAYCTDETGHMEVYVTTFPVPSRKILVSTEGGVAPVWASNGQRLYYWSSDWNKLMAVEVTTDPTFIAGTPHYLFDFPLRSASYLRPYDITRDGTRFLVVGREEVKPVEGTRLILVQNWFEEVKRLVPAK